MPTTLAIETSCDDTSVSLVRETDGEFFVDQLRSFSQVDIHQPYGGVVPELAYRSHTDKLIRLLEEI
jgi:N6-L-threonylcarbamoyladenine synthase